MVLDEKRMTAEVPMVVAHALSEIKEALRELRDALPESMLVRLAEQKLALIEQGDGARRNLSHSEQQIVASRRND
jgi:hypothetical protein